MLTNEIKDKLIQRAKEAWGRAYAPYSNYNVGAALLTESGEIYDGVNVENAVYPVGICGERTAIFKAVSEGHRSFQAIAVVTKNGGTPCGACRQVMAEFGLDTIVLIANTDGELIHQLSVAELLPYSFGEKDVK
ncbi:MAG: cytidine deaminase [Brevefilum sp.]|nr:cytidine deaminase [Brevefilum sp.]MDT8382482.1 cytidine deaminase [Brevefilum sp.]MDW7753707.1 cytidine deaminase [Brevefilum sp.]